MSSDVIQQLKTEPLSMEEIKHMSRGKADVILYDHIKPGEDLFKNSDCVIVLMQVKDTGSDVGHFVLIKKGNDTVEHFDPYGLSLAEDLSLTHEPSTIKSALQDYNIEENKYKFQSKKPDVNTCGRWCVMRCLHSDMSLDDFKRYIDTMAHGDDYDTAITKMTIALQPNH